MNDHCTAVSSFIHSRQPDNTQCTSTASTSAMYWQCTASTGATYWQCTSTVSTSVTYWQCVDSKPVIYCLYKGNIIILWCRYTHAAPHLYLHTPMPLTCIWMWGTSQSIPPSRTSGSRTSCWNWGATSRLSGRTCGPSPPAVGEGWEGKKRGVTMYLPLTKGLRHTFYWLKNKGMKVFQIFYRNRVIYGKCCGFESQSHNTK